jgi:hypothetical protein
VSVAQPRRTNTLIEAEQICRPGYGFFEIDCKRNQSPPRAAL